jgi:L-threonylcarbamoyladenylate synthase
MNSNSTLYIYPTDTVWGIGCNIESEVGFKKIAQIKNTDSDKPLSILFTNKIELEEYVSFEKTIDKTVMYQLFSRQVTLLISNEILKKEMPPYLKEKSNFTSIRFIENSLLTKIRKRAGGPFFTTSLNLTGMPSITDSTEAINFKNTYCPDAIFFELDAKIPRPTGISSTILKLEESKFKIIRKGNAINEIENYLSKLNLL